MAGLAIVSDWSDHPRSPDAEHGRPQFSSDAMSVLRMARFGMGLLSIPAGSLYSQYRTPDDRSPRCLAVAG